MGDFMDEFMRPNSRLKRLELLERSRLSYENSTVANRVYTVPELIGILSDIGVYSTRGKSKAELVDMVLEELEKYEYNHRLYRPQGY